MSFFSGAATAKLKNSNFHFLIYCKILHTKEPYWGQNSKGLGTQNSSTHQHQLEAVTTQRAGFHHDPWGFTGLLAPATRWTTHQADPLVPEREKTAVEEHPVLLSKHPALPSFATTGKDSLPCQQGSVLQEHKTLHSLYWTTRKQCNLPSFSHHTENGTRDFKC